MKFLFLVLFLGVAQATILTDYQDIDVHRDALLREGVDVGFWNRRDVKIPVDKNLVKIQVDVIKLLNRINHLSTDKFVLDIYKTYRLEDHLDSFIDKNVVIDLIRWYKTEGFLGRDKVFNILDDHHRYEVITISKVLVGAKDLLEFFKVACWLRNHVNGEVFTYALTFAVRNRVDCYGIILPPMYEIFPMKFFKNKVIQKAVQLKMQGQIFDERYAKTLGIERVDKNVYVLKTDYTGVNINNFGDDKLTYFTEDIGLNNNFFMYHVTHPFWIDYNRITPVRHNNYGRGEWFLFARQQLLARYYMERLSHGLGDIPKFKWDLPIKTGYNPSLRHNNGLEYSVRPNNYIVNNVDNLWDLKIVKDFERRIRNAIDRGYIWTVDGKIVSLKNPEDIDTLGNLIECNGASVNRRFFHGLRTTLKLLGNRRAIDDNTGVTPSVLESFTTVLRDPIYYQLLKRIMQNVYIFTDKIRPYGFDDLLFKGVVVKDVKVDKLVTFFDTYDVDITNVVNRDIDEMRSNMDDIIIKTRQVRLNHLPFTVNVDVASDITTDAVVKIFLGPKLDGHNRIINWDENRHNFLLLDHHKISLRKGVNTITRNSRLFNLVTDDMHTTRKLINKIENCFKGVEECFTREIRHSVVIPDRLILPRGTNGGMVFQLFVTVTPIRSVRTDNTFIDTLRYPLDRKIMRVKEFLSVDNFFLRDVIIYHKEGIVDKYTGDIDRKFLDFGSSESFEDVDRKNLYLNKHLIGRNIDSNEKFWDRSLDSIENFRDRKLVDVLDRRFDSVENVGDRWNVRNMLDTKLNDKRRFFDVLGRRVDSLEDVSRFDSSMENKFLGDKDVYYKRFLNHKLLDRNIHSDENIPDLDSMEIKKNLLYKKYNFIPKRFL